ncbi:MAG: hypothetical protein RBR77_01065 [Thauera sp.]|jgi:hypothetical protein|nr:hypothetical protein [Thauera sp.]
MKLFDLLRSLNTGTATDPDAPAAIAPSQRALLLDELREILLTLDTEPDAASIPATMPTAPRSLLNLDDIFDEAAGADTAPAHRRQQVQALFDTLLSTGESPARGDSDDGAELHPARPLG